MIEYRLSDTHMYFDYNNINQDLLHFQQSVVIFTFARRIANFSGFGQILYIYVLSPITHKYREVYTKLMISWWVKNRSHYIM